MTGAGVKVCQERCIRRSHGISNNCIRELKGESGSRTIVTWLARCWPASGHEAQRTHKRLLQSAGPCISNGNRRLRHVLPSWWCLLGRKDGLSQLSGSALFSDTPSPAAATRPWKIMSNLELQNSLEIIVYQTHVSTSIKTVLRAMENLLPSDDFATSPTNVSHKNPRKSNDRHASFKAYNSHFSSSSSLGSQKEVVLYNTSCIIL